MKNLTFRLILAGAAASSMVAVAFVGCNDSTPIPTPGADGSVANDAAATDSAAHDATTSDAGTTDTGTTSDASASTACQPSLHQPKADGGIYCPFSYNDATDAGTQYCTRGTQMCCISPSSDAGPSTCGAFGDTCTNTTFATWQCNSPLDCTGAPVDGGGAAPVCCLVAGPLEQSTADDAGCTYSKTKGFDRATCTAASACTGTVQVPKPGDAGGFYTDDNFVMCEQDADCTGIAGTTHCQAIKTTGVEIGVCQ